MNRYQWNLADARTEQVRQMAALLRIPPLLARCIANRGCDCADGVARYLEPRLAHLKDPFSLPGMDRAVDRLLRAHAARERLVIFGDYDVDGVTSTALLTEFFGAFGWRSDCYLPHRLEEGYGLSRDAVQRCLEKFQTNLLLAVDCGSSAADVIAELGERNIEVIVLDHHQVSAPPPCAAALVNPQLGPDQEAKGLCSAGLAFKLAHALLKRCRALRWPGASDYDLRELLDLVALGTIADLVPLKGENRIFAKAGLERLGKTRRSGLAALKKVSGIEGPVSCQEVAFQLGPRLNAAGRLETALDALALLLTKDPDRAESLAAALDEQNRERQKLERGIAEQVIRSVRSRFDPERDYAIVEGDASWHLGVVGIVASRVLREFHRPVVILGSDGTDQWRGSGRSVRSFDLAAALRACGELLVKSGGHAMAAGVTMQAARLAEFRGRLNELVQSAVPRSALDPELAIDSEVNLHELDFQTLRALERLHPIGHGNPPVHLVCRGLHLRGVPLPAGAGQQHRRFTVTDGHTNQQALWWNCGAEFVFPSRFDLAFTPELNLYNGTFGVQLKVLDLQPSSSA